MDKVAYFEIPYDGAKRIQKRGKIFLKSGIMGKMAVQIFLTFVLHGSIFKKGRNQASPYKVNWDEEIR